MTFNGLKYQNHQLAVPLVWDDPSDSRTIEIFARVVTAQGGEDLPYLVFLQGGPGYEASRPSLKPTQPSWLAVALQRYQVVMLDQRGTGRSTPVGNELLSLPVEEAAEYCSHLRADAIVRDCEAVREHLGATKWSVLGQSFGGFTLLHYLSKFAGSLHRAYFTGGLSAVGHHCDDIYTLTHEKMATRSEEFYRLFPGDRDRMAKASELAAKGKLVLPNDDLVSPSRLQSVGHVLGSNDGAVALHWLLDHDPTSNAFSYDLAKILPFDTRNPLYAILHESSYADGCTTDWSADRTRPAIFDQDRTLLTGEHIYRQWFSEQASLQPWAKLADALAQVSWPKLYDSAALQASDAIGAAAVYYGDVFVPMEFSAETASYLPGVRTFITSTHEHNGLRASDGEVLQYLFELAAGERIR